MPYLSGNRIAIVFGNEVNGLENDDIALCHELISIPSSSAFPSLNLSHAVMVVAYELFVAAQAKLPASDRTLAPSGELEQFYEHFQKSLQDMGFIDKAHPEHMMFSLRQLFGRSRLDSREVSILRGILSQIERSSKIQKK
jgi:tRNA/rRNA methyltransferase